MANNHCFKEASMDKNTRTAQSPVPKGKKQKIKKQRSPGMKFIFRTIKILIILFTVIAFAVAGIAFGAIYGYIKTASPLTGDQLQLKNFTSFVYDSNGKIITQLNGEQNRVWVNDKDIPLNIKNAFVAIEDERFYQHNGIDIKRILGVTLSYITKGKISGGGSTITQQLVKNLTGDTSFSLQRKVQEQWRAIQLEQKWEKWQILESYLNVVPEGRVNSENLSGVQSAAKAYFNKDIKQLDLAECACLAAIPNNPNIYQPTTPKTKENNKERQNLEIGRAHV
jgi:penicillin-binding protein 1A